MNKQGGFTLLELILILVVVVVILGLNTPRLKDNLHNQEFRTLSKQLYLLIDYLHTQAILKAEIKHYLYDQDKKTFLLKNGGEDQKLFRRVKIPKSVRVEVDKNEIVFFPNGEITPFAIEIFGEKERYASIKSLGFDGKIILSNDQEKE